MSARQDGCGADVAAYALGALGDDEARAFERHLEGCELCRRDLADLQPVVAALPAAAERVDPPPALRKRIMRVVEEEARERGRAEAPRRASRFGWIRLRPLPALAAACVLLLAGLGIGIALQGDDETQTYAAQTRVPGASAELRVEGDDSTLFVEGMPPPPRGRVYQVWLQRDRGTPQPTDALFTVAGDGSAQVAVPGGVDGVRAVLVTDEPDGGSRVPTRTPAMVVRTT